MGNAASSMSALWRPAAHDLDSTERDSQPSGLPAFDKALRTKYLVILCLCISSVCILLCWAAGAYVLATGEGHLLRHVSLSEAQLEGLAFFFTLLITFCSDTLGYVHATALRWALYREGRLIYNTNFRLFTSAKTSFPNRWYMNLLAALCLALCYACIAALIVRENYSAEDYMAINGLSLLILGAGLLGLAVSALLCIYHGTSRIPTWSSNPFTNTLAYLHEQEGLQSSRSSYTACGEARQADRAVQQSQKIFSLWTFRSAKWIVLFIWALCCLCFIWMGIVIAIPMAMYSPNYEFVFNWTGDREQRVMFGMDPITNSPRVKVSFPLGVQCFLAILFLCFVQGLQVLGLHCIELLVNMTRDEMSWRQAGRQSGATLTSEPLLAAYTSWRTIVLTALKSGIHWLVSQCLIPNYHVPTDPLPYDYPEFIFSMSPSRLLILGGAVCLAAVYATALAFWPLKGIQPTTWGNMRLLADWVQDWNSSDGKIRWEGRDEMARHEQVQRVHDELQRSSR